MSDINKILEHKDEREHALLRPGNYIGSTDPEEKKTWILDQDNKIKYVTIQIIDGLKQIFEEPLMNASDHAMRPRTGVKNIWVNFDLDNNIITIENDGTGIPINKHKQTGLWGPEAAFTTLIFADVVAKPDVSPYPDS